MYINCQFLLFLPTEIFFKKFIFLISPEEAIDIQVKLSHYISIKNYINTIRYIAASDISFNRNDTAVACIAVFGFPSLDLAEERIASMQISFPYIPTLLTFREGPLLLKGIKNLKTNSDLFLFDGQGIVHPRRMGLATHMGIILDKPSIGCAKTNLFGDYEMPENKKGAYSFLKDRNKILGVALRTRRDVKPVFVSPGHKISLRKSIEIIIHLTGKFRIPEPLRYAHRRSKELLSEKS